MEKTAVVYGASTRNSWRSKSLYEVDVRVPNPIHITLTLRPVHGKMSMAATGPQQAKVEA